MELLLNNIIRIIRTFFHPFLFSISRSNTYTHSHLLPGIKAAARGLFVRTWQ